MTRDQVHDLLQPSITSLNTVVQWLQSAGVASYSLPTRDFLHANATVEQAEALLQSPYYIYEHPGAGTAIRLSSPHYTVPVHVSQHLDFISPTIRFPPVQRAKRGAQAWFKTTPYSIRKLYKMGNTVGSQPRNKQAVTAFLEQYYSPSDQAEFYQSEYKTASGQGISMVGDPEAFTGSGAGVEAMLDSEYIVVTGTNVPTEFWAFSGRAPDNPENEPFLKWLIQVAATNDEDVPKVFSTSYGEDESSITEQYASRINIEFQKAGARGITLLFASGDSGAGGDDGCEGANNSQFVPQWPAASPFVTAVGGTEGVISSSGEIIREKGASLSSGGFSNRYDRPWWQKKLVDRYLVDNTVPLNHITHVQGRAFPDVAALATGYTVVANGGALPQVAGTSCSCPVVAGIISLLNDIRYQQGKSTLGFINPVLYLHPEAFNDITEGSNSGCKWTSTGFESTVGWDPVTGLGTPDFEKLADVVRNLL